MSEFRRDVLLWFGLAAAFSPLLHHLVENFLADPGERYVLLSPILMGLLLWKQSNSRLGDRRPYLGSVFLIVGLSLEMLGLAGDVWSIARLGLPIAIVGTSLITSRPHVRVALLAFAAVPIPDFVVHAASPWFQSVVAAGAEAVLNSLGSQVESRGPLLRFGGERFELLPSDSGLVTAVLLAEIGWYLSVRNVRTFEQATLQAASWALFTIVLQPFLVLLCVSTLTVGAPKLGRFVLSYGVLIVLCVGVPTSQLIWPGGVRVGNGENNDE